jgi:1-phosphatidylinositol-3-phosphate 5-kinase
MPNEEEKYIHSLFRCMNWDAKGGKSNSQFRKTIDNRFVLKEMSKQEVQSFLEFTPQYVQYITDNIQNKVLINFLFFLLVFFLKIYLKKATALAKILGAYQICLMKNTTISSKAVKMDVIVMENLFYGKKFSQVFDLKGSERNRMVNVNNQTNKQEEKDLVLLDENFLRCIYI